MNIDITPIRHAGRSGSCRKSLLQKISALALIGGLALSGRVFSQEVLFQSKPGDSLSPEWVSVYSHLSGVMTVGIAPATGGPETKALTFDLKETAPQDAAGKAAYFRSNTIHGNYGKLAMEWMEDFPLGVSGPEFEVWGNVTGKPNELGKRVLSIGQNNTGLTMGKIATGYRGDGWRRVKIVIDTKAKVFDLYYDNMTVPAAAKMPLLFDNTEWDMIGIGFCLYVKPGSAPAKWQVAGVKVTGE